MMARMAVERSVEQHKKSNFGPNSRTDKGDVEVSNGRQSTNDTVKVR